MPTTHTACTHAYLTENDPFFVYDLRNLGKCRYTSRLAWRGLSRISMRKWFVPYQSSSSEHRHLHASWIAFHAIASCIPLISTPSWVHSKTRTTRPPTTRPARSRHTAASHCRMSQSTFARAARKIDPIPPSLRDAIYRLRIQTL